MKIILRIFVAALLFCAVPAQAQHNPFLDKKAKNKPSAKMAKENRKTLKKQKKSAKKQMRRSKKGLNRKGKR